MNLENISIEDLSKELVKRLKGKEIKKINDVFYLGILFSELHEYYLGIIAEEKGEK